VGTPPIQQVCGISANFFDWLSSPGVRREDGKSRTSWYLVAKK
jgi:hypothetical protein